MNFLSNGDIYEDIYLQTGDIPINRRRRRFAKILYFVAPVELVGCPREFLGRIESGLGLELWLVFGCMSPASRYDVYSVTTCAEMCGIMTVRKQNGKERPLAGAKIACCTHVTAQTAVSPLQLKFHGTDTDTDTDTDRAATVGLPQDCRGADFRARIGSRPGSPCRCRCP